MSASPIAERSAAYDLQAAVPPEFGASFDLLATAPKSVAKLRELILSFAIRGKLVPQDAADESASSLLERILKERKKLEAVGALKCKSAVEAHHDEEWTALPENWAWSCLACIGMINPRIDVSDETEASFVQMSSVPVALMEPHKTERRPWREIKSGFTHFAEGDVGVAKITPCFENGKSTVFRNLDSGVGAGTTELHVVRPLAGIRPDYILIFLKAPEFLLPGEKRMTGSAGQKRMSRQYFETRAFPVPPLAEQARIVARVQELMQLCDALEAHGRLQDEQHARLVTTLFAALAASESAHALAENWQRIATHFDLLLDRAEAVDALEQIILELAVRGLLVPQDADDEPARSSLELIQSAKQQVIASDKAKRRGTKNQTATVVEAAAGLPEGWEWASLSDLVTVLNGRAYAKQELLDAGTPVLRVGNLFTSKHWYYSNLELEDDKYCDAGDLLFAWSASFGPFIWAGPKVIYHYHIWKLALHSETEFYKDYLYTFLLKKTREMKASGHGVSMLHITKEAVEKIPVPVPPLAEQHRIVARVKQLRRLCTDLRERLQQARATQSQLADALVTTAAQLPTC